MLGQIPVRSHERRLPFTQPYERKDVHVKSHYRSFERPRIRKVRARLGEVVGDVPTSDLIGPMVMVPDGQGGFISWHESQQRLLAADAPSLPAGWINGAGPVLKTEPEQESESAPEEEGGFWAAVATAEAKIAEFGGLYAELRDLLGVALTDRALDSAYRSLMERGEGIRQKVRIIEDAIARGRSWLAAVNPFSQPFSGTLEGLGAQRRRGHQLGLVPLVLIGIAAAISAAVAYVAGWVGEAVVLRDRLRAREAILARVDTGTLSPAEAESLIESGLEDGGGDGFEVMTMFQVLAWGAAAAGAIFLARTVRG